LLLVAGFPSEKRGIKNRQRDLKGTRPKRRPI
jgi:hypothetical protein